MMRPSINKFKLYLYLFFFIFLTSIFNFKFIEDYHNKFNLKTIIINGLSPKEKKLLESEFKDIKNINIFKLNKDKILERLKKYNFLEDIYVSKIIPSSININLSKTEIVGKTVINSEIFYIGKNGKLINSNYIEEFKNIPTIFGDFNTKEYLYLLKILNDQELETQNIEKLYFYKNKRWDLLFSNNKTLMLPSNKVEESINIYKKLLKNGNLINTKVIDLRVKNQIILTNSNE